MSEVLGIDVSHYQKNIDWSKVSGSGKKFAILKAMYEAQSHRIDETFEANYRGAGQNGMSRGVYILLPHHQSKILREMPSLSSESYKTGLLSMVSGWIMSQMLWQRLVRRKSIC